MTPQVDPARIRRALGLIVEALPDGAYLVTGGAEPHRVDHDGRRWRCDCADYRLRGEVCKHRLAVYLDGVLDVRVREALRDAAESPTPVA